MSRTQLILVALILGGAAAAIYFMMGDADQKAIDKLIRDCAQASLDREPAVIVDHLADDFTFTVANKTIAAEEARRGGPRLLKEAAPEKFDIRTLEISRDGDNASASLTVVIESGASPIKSPYPMQLEFDLRRNPADPKDWLFVRGILKPLERNQ